MEKVYEVTVITFAREDHYEFDTLEEARTAYHQHIADAIRLEPPVEIALHNLDENTILEEYEVS